MSGLINVSGASSGVVGATVAASSVSGMTLLYAANTNLSGNGVYTIASGARGTGTGASGSGYLFQTDYFYYKAYIGGIQFSNGYPGMRGVDASNNVITSAIYNQVNRVRDSNGDEHDHSNKDRAEIPLTQRYDHSSNHRGSAGSSSSNCGNSAMEISFYNPAGPTFTSWNWTHTQCNDADSDMRSAYGAGSLASVGAWGGFNIFSQATSDFSGYLNVAVYGLASMAYDA